MNAVSPRGFKMRLMPGSAEEYRRRHDALWPELADLLRAAGASNYSIHLDAEDGQTLFAVLTEAQPACLEKLSDHPVMRRWWAHMADLMQTDAEQRPIVWPMARMFHLS